MIDIYFLIFSSEGGVKMHSEGGQTLTWHEECLQCSVCSVRLQMDNVVFRDKLFCKSCYIQTSLNRCRPVCENISSSTKIFFLWAGARRAAAPSRARATASAGCSGTTAASAATGAARCSPRASSACSGRRSSVIPASNLPHTPSNNALYS